MQPLFGEDHVCPECLYKGEPEKSLEDVWNKEGCLSILRICPSCGRTSIVGESCAGEEFYY